MHASDTDLIGAVVCAIAVVRFWRLILVLVLMAAVLVVILGVAAAVSYINH
jgi:hypothetical protein